MTCKVFYISDKIYERYSFTVWILLNVVGRNWNESHVVTFA